MRIFWFPRRTTRPAAGFLLIELLLALAVGLALLGLIAQSILQETGQSRRLGRLLRERVVTQRALELIRSEVEDALLVSFELPEIGHDNCGLSNRKVMLHLQTAAGKITYSIESKPALIWRGQALMRCGPSYSLRGVLAGTDQQSRVVLDSLVPDAMVVGRSNADRQIVVLMKRQFIDQGRSLTSISSRVLMAAPGLQGEIQ